MSDIIVKFKPSGHRKLIKAINMLQVASGKSTKATKLQTKAGNGLLKTNRLLDSSFATMRSHMLLFNFAMSLGVRQLAKFGKESAKLDSVNRAFVTMTGGTRLAASGMDKLRKATNNTMSDFDLFRQANSSMLLGITDNTSEMAEMFDMSQRLGRALGNDTVQSVEALIFGLGRMSVKRLDDIGIIVKANQAYRDYAAANNTIVSKLTDTQKRQAFFNAALESGRQKLSTMGPEVLTHQDRIDKLTASYNNLGTRIGSVVNDSMIPLIETMVKFNDSIDTGTIKEIKNVILSLAGTMAILWARTKAVKIGLAAFAKIVTATKVAAVASIGGITMALRTFFAVLAAGTGGTLLLAGGIASLIYSYLNWNTEQEKVNKNLGTTITKTSTLQEELDNLILAGPEMGSMLMGSMDEMKTFMDSYAAKIAFVKQKIKETREETEKNAAIEELDSANKESLIAAYTATKEAQIALIQTTIDYAEARKLDGELNAEELKGLEALIAKKEKLNDIDRVAADAKLKAQNAVGNAFKGIGVMVKANAKEMAAIEVTMSLINAYGSFLKTMNSPAMLINPTATTVMAYANLAAGIASSVVIAQQASKLGAGGGGGAPQFEQGGYVGGNRHSQGGTMIEAERGEFVMSRNAVESIGTETLNQMNQGGGGGNINVSVTGNVLTQDFVEGELAEAIKEAVRRGSDFGLS